VFRKQKRSKYVLAAVALAALATSTPSIAQFSDVVSVKTYGAKGNGTTDDTTAVQNAFNSGKAGIYFPKGTYKVRALTVPDSVAHIYGHAELLQAVDANNILNVVGVNDLLIEGLSFRGVGGNLNESRNTAIEISAGSSHIRVRENTFTAFRHHAVHALGSSDIQIVGNRITGITGGIRLTACSRVRVSHNYLAFPQYTGFTVAIGLDSTDTPPYGVCTDVVISENIVESYVNAQAIMIHAGQRLAVANNILRDVLIGVSMNPFQPGDILRDVTVVGNVYQGTTTPGAAANNGNYGIFAGGGPGFVADHVTIGHNVVAGANKVVQSYGQGGIGLGYADDVLLSGNVVRDSMAAGIALGNPGTRLMVRGNSITDVVAAPDTTWAGIYARGGASAGRIEDNQIDGAAWGMRFDLAMPDLRIGPNDLANFDYPYINPSNATIATVFDGLLHVHGDLTVSGSKNFVERHPTDPDKRIAYVSLEGPESGTYVRGTATLSGGEALIELPEHFSMVTREEGLTVQLAPVGEPLQLYTVEKSTRRIVVREAAGRSGRFDYVVQGVRNGFEHRPVIQPVGAARNQPIQDPRK
jgi:nitrous oxidase accessory protein NosD